MTFLGSSCIGANTPWRDFLPTNCSIQLFWHHADLSSYEETTSTMNEQPERVGRGVRWDSGDAYEPYVGRWSRLVAREFVKWLALPPGSRWLDVGCGTGALTQTLEQVASSPCRPEAHL